MALGGGTFLTQNKILAGSYINFVTKPVATATLLDRGVIAIGLELDWGADGIQTIETNDLLRNSLVLFGYDYANGKLNGIKDVFLNAVKVYVYRLNGGGVKASNTYATAKYSGTRGNNIKIVIETDVDNSSNKVVSTYLDTTLVDTQSVASASELVDNDYVTFKTTATLAVTAGINLSGGTNGTNDATKHQAFLDECENYPDINAIAYAGTDDAIKALYVAWAKYMRDSVGVKLQAVVYNYSKADYEGVVNVKNSADLVYWATGVIGGTAVNKSATNKKYDGNFDIQVKYTQSQLESCIKNGEWVLHKVGEDIRLLEDINSFTSTTDDKGEVLQDNQTIRIIDQIATAVATVFNDKYLGKVPNNADGRTSLWADIVKVHTELQDISALEDFSPEDIVVEQGTAKKSVVVTESITVVNAMVRLYMTVVVG